MTIRGDVMGVIKTIVIAPIAGDSTVPTVIPSNTVLPSVAGFLDVGQTLTANVGSWANGPITSYAYQWQQSPDGVGTWTNIGGAINQTYVVAIAAGLYVRVQVKATNVVGQSAAAPSPSRGPLAAALSISGTPVTTATQNSAYAGFSAAGAGGHAPYAYSLAPLSSPLPVGITLNAATGAVSGVPTVVSGYPNIIIRVTDADGLTADLASFTITVSPTSSAGALQFNFAANSGLGVATGVW